MTQVNAGCVNSIENLCSNIDMAKLARTHQKSSVLRADTANLRIEEVARVDLYQIFQISKVSNHLLII